MDQNIKLITRLELKHKIDQHPPNNLDRSHGYALINVLSPEEYRKAHIPESINIPKGREEEFENRFAKNKELILYCASSECPAASSVAKTLLNDYGFNNIIEYKGGMSDWREANYLTASGSAGLQSERNTPIAL